MKIKKAIKVLKNHNKWRRGSSLYLEMENPRTLGIAIDTVIDFWQEKNRFKKLNKRVIKWADKKGILDKGTPIAQQAKTEEEVAELREALFAKNNWIDDYINYKGVFVNTDEEIIDGLGDVLVTILIQCNMQGLNPLKCLKTALKVIEKREGKMINGTFVKN